MFVILTASLHSIDAKTGATRIVTVEAWVHHHLHATFTTIALVFYQYWIAFGLVVRCPRSRQIISSGRQGSGLSKTYTCPQKDVPFAGRLSTEHLLVAWTKNSSNGEELTILRVFPIVIHVNASLGKGGCRNARSERQR